MFFFNIFLIKYKKAQCGFDSLLILKKNVNFINFYWFFGLCREGPKRLIFVRNKMRDVYLLLIIFFIIYYSLFIISEILFILSQRRIAIFRVCVCPLLFMLPQRGIAIFHVCLCLCVCACAWYPCITSDVDLGSTF